MSDSVRGKLSPVLRDAVCSALQRLSCHCACGLFGFRHWISAVCPEISGSGFRLCHGAWIRQILFNFNSYKKKERKKTSQNSTEYSSKYPQAVGCLRTFTSFHFQTSGGHWEFTLRASKTMLFVVTLNLLVLCVVLIFSLNETNCHLERCYLKP